MLPFLQNPWFTLFLLGLWSLLHYALNVIIVVTRVSPLWTTKRFKSKDSVLFFFVSSEHWSLAHSKWSINIYSPAKDYAMLKNKTQQIILPTLLSLQKALR